MINVPAWFYRTLWITVAVLGAICAVGSVALMFGEGVTIVSGGPSLIAAGAFGAVMLIYAAWRLIRPLRPPPKE